MTQQTVLCIDVTDPSGCNGLNAAIRTIHGLGGHAQTVVSAVTVQTPEQVLGLYKIPTNVVVDQMRAAFSSFPVGVVLIALVPDKDTIDGIADMLDSLETRPKVIIDPIIFSRDGKRFLEKDDLDQLKKRLIANADLLMPNLLEAQTLSGLTIDNEASMENAAEMLLTLGCRNVFMKGLGLTRKNIYDIYADDRRTQVFESEMITAKQTYGAGAILAAAVATKMAAGQTPRESVTQSRMYLEDMLRHNPDLTLS